MIRWIAEEGTEPPAHRLFIDGVWKEPVAGGYFTDHSPATGRKLAQIADVGVADVEQAVAAAVAAQPGWSALTPAERSEVFYRAADIFAERQDELVGLLCEETGSGYGKAAYEASLVPLALRDAAGLTTHDLGEILPSNIPGKVNRTLRTPVGVIGVITPWNFPLYLTIRGFVHAMALGNAIVLKPAEDSPVIGGLALAELFTDAGLPPGILNVITASRENAAMVGEFLTDDKRVPVLSFTGSSAVGRTLAVACAENFKRIKLELGGKNPVIVLPGADIDRAVEIVGFAGFLHQGQICLSADRILVSQEQYQEFVQKIIARAKTFVPTLPSDPNCVNGPIINTRQLERIVALIEESEAAGAKVHCGGRAQPPYYESTVITDVTPQMRIWREEIFGPAVIVTPYSNVDQAVELANGLFTDEGVDAVAAVGASLPG
ncbi:aldehyde dehydrogenase family protein [Tsukamurella soli]|uniref:Aldehyde dehydrogenase family protein n=1 Tax=Tsukamurella soli TaxID=644556 RepID=A0ABP8JS02_9ACTN